MNKQVKTKTHRKIKVRYGALLVFALFIYLLIYFFDGILNKNITNIYVSNNITLSTQRVIEIALLDDFPSSFQNSSSKIKNTLESNIYIEKAKVYKKNYTEVYIEIEENYPIFHYDSMMQTVLKDGTKVTDEFMVPTLINYVPDTLYSTFIKSMSSINRNILLKMSEIKYDPNDVDDGRFLISMNDNNYVYLTLDKFSSINSYLDIVVNLEGKKGILYLDSGNYFTIIE